MQWLLQEPLSDRIREYPLERLVKYIDELSTILSHAVL